MLILFFDDILQKVPAMVLLSKNLPSVIGAGIFLGCCVAIASQCDPKYFTTWALYLHATTFAAFVIVRGGEPFYEFLRFSRELYVWGFSPCLCTAVCVLATSTYLLFGAWDEIYDEYCLPDAVEIDRRDRCLDFALEFTVTHGAPPVFLALFALLDGGTRTGAPSKKVKSTIHKDVILFASHVFLTTAVAPVVYGGFFKMKRVYGESVSELVSTVIYVAANACTAYCCASYYIEA